MAALSLSSERTRAPSTSRLCGLVRKSSPPASIAFTRSVVSLSAVTKMTGMRAVRGSRLMRRHTSNPVVAVVHAEVAGGHRDVEDAEVGLLLEAGGERRRPVVRRDRAEAEHVELVEEQLHVRRNVVGDEDERRVGRGRRELGHRIRGAP